MRAATSLFALYDYDLKCIEGRHIKDIFKSSLWVEPKSKRFILLSPPGCVPQSVGHLTRKSWVRYPVWPHTFVSPSADSRGPVVSYWRQYVHEVLINRLGGLSLPSQSVVRLTDVPT